LLPCLFLAHDSLLGHSNGIIWLKYVQHQIFLASLLVRETRGCFTDPNWNNCWESVTVDPAPADAAPQIVRAYLSRQHFENVENSCPIVRLRERGSPV
jgi:hypothetical protein